MTFASIVILAVIYCFLQDDKETEVVRRKDKPLDTTTWEINNKERALQKCDALFIRKGVMKC